MKNFNVETSTSAGLFLMHLEMLQMQKFGEQRLSNLLDLCAR